MKAEIWSLIWSVMFWRVTRIRLSVYLRGALQQRRERFVDRFASSEDARAHGAHRALHGLRDLFVAQAFDFAKQNGGAQLFGQRMDRTIDRVANLFRLRERLGSVELAQLVQYPGLLGILRVEV